MTSSPRTTGRRRRSLLLAAAVGTATALSACGVPGGGHARTVDDDTVPYHLLAPGSPSSDPASDSTVPRLVPVVFWLLGDDRLVPAPVGGSCTDPPEELAARQLTDLALGPGEDERSAGRSSALPTNPGLRLVALAGGTAQVELDPSTAISADRLPLAIAQVVLSLTSTSAIDHVTFVTSHDPVQVPLPGGALITRPVSASDYAGLVTRRYRASTARGARLVASVGCRGR